MKKIVAGLVALLFIMTISCTIPVKESRISDKANEVNRNNEPDIEIKKNTNKIKPKESLEFRGFVLGMSKDEVERKIREELKDNNPIFLMNYFYRIPQLIKGVFVYVDLCFGYYNSTSDTLNHFEMIIIPSTYDTLKEALIEKYGTPTNVQAEVLQNLMGAQFENEITSWSLPNGLIFIDKYGESYKQGKITMLGLELKQELEKKLQKAKAAPGF